MFYRCFKLARALRIKAFAIFFIAHYFNNKKYEAKKHTIFKLKKP